MSNLVDFTEIRPDAMLVATRRQLTLPEPGHLDVTIVENATLTRYDKLTVFTMLPAGPLEPEVRTYVGEDVETAAVAFSNVADSLRRDGWDVRLPDPWDLPAKMDDQRTPF